MQPLWVRVGQSYRNEEVLVGRTSLILGVPAGSSQLARIGHREVLFFERPGFLPI